MSQKSLTIKQAHKKKTNNEMVDPNPTTLMIALSFNDKVSNKKPKPTEWRTRMSLWGTDFKNTDSGWK